MLFHEKVKRMLAAVGNKVVELHRQTVANIELDPTLSLGEYRELTVEEVAQVQKKGVS